MYVSFTYKPFPDLQSALDSDECHDFKPFHEEVGY